jgi:uncharacterized protein (DUF2249 family)
MGGQLDWHALPVVMELIGLHDPEPLIDQLVTLRDYKAARHGQ